MSTESMERLSDDAGPSARRSGKVRYRDLRPLAAITSSPPMTATYRLIAAAYLVVVLLIAVIGEIFSIGDLRTTGVALFLLTGWGIAPTLLVGSMSVSAFVLASGAISFSATTVVGFAMARTGMWHPGIALLFAVVSAVAMLAFAVPADLRSVRFMVIRTTTPFRTGVRWWVLTVLGCVLMVVDSFDHRGLPEEGGLLARVGPLWFVGAAVLIAAVVLAWITDASPALPLLTLITAVIAAQAILYGAPAVMSAGKHVGVLEYIRDNGLGADSADIYQAWPGLFASGAWVTDAAGIADPMTLATWFPVALTVYTALAIRNLAGRFLQTAAQAWTAAAIATLGATVNIVYFSPQSVGYTLCLVIAALLIGARPDSAGRLWMRYGFVAVLTCVVTITHQISPYLMVAELTVLVVFRLIRPWWIPLAVLVPAVGWALLHKSSLGGFVSLDAIGQIFTNIAPPVHGGTTLPQPLVTRLAFDIPAAVLVVVGILAIVAVLRKRDRTRFALLLAGASSGSLFAVTNYGSEGIFRVVLFAVPWLAILAVMAFEGVRTDRAVMKVAVGLALVGLFMVNTFGQTGLDWARVVRPDSTTAIREFETTAKKGAVLLVVGTGNATPGHVTARYNDVQYASRESLNDYPLVTSAYDPVQDLAQLTTELQTQVPGVQHWALMSDSVGAWDDRYGMQTYADYLRLEQAMATSPSWTLVSSGVTTKLYRMTGVGGS
ncbi:hypothetical protein ABIB25_001354 [Nakamurella sp. UYEF19]|uniref:hypothetical protein n=1 Tax=Nakamurella sp. UYEF19 TaxID=1756392 RepID=UPI0033938C50